MSPENPRPGSELCFRACQGPAELGLLQSLLRESRIADGDSPGTEVEEIGPPGLPLSSSDPWGDIVLASLGEDGRPLVPLGYSQLGSYSTFDGQRILFQESRLSRLGRDRGLWPRIVRENDRRLGLWASARGGSSGYCLQAWASDRDGEWMAALKAEGYHEARHYHNMVHPLDSIPDYPLPGGLELRPVSSSDLRQVWEAQRAMNEGLFEGVAEDWTEAAEEGWLADPDRDPRLWQLAWSGTRLAGMVLPRGGSPGQDPSVRHRGYAEHIYVAPSMRKRGLARALLCRGLRALAAEGFKEAELGVDEENRSGAFSLYHGLRFRTESIDTWLRKEMP